MSENVPHQDQARARGRRAGGRQARRPARAGRAEGRAPPARGPERLVRGRTQSHKARDDESPSPVTQLLSTRHATARNSPHRSPHPSKEDFIMSDHAVQSQAARPRTSHRAARGGTPGHRLLVGRARRRDRLARRLAGHPAVRQRLDHHRRRPRRPDVPARRRRRTSPSRPCPWSIAGCRRCSASCSWSPRSSASSTLWTRSPGWPTCSVSCSCIVGMWWMVRAFLERAVNPTVVARR